jgi:hypothetical protein
VHPVQRSFHSGTTFGGFTSDCENVRFSSNLSVPSAVISVCSSLELRLRIFQGKSVFL